MLANQHIKQHKSVHTPLGTNIIDVKSVILKKHGITL
jgi:hypothetical protein